MNRAQVLEVIADFLTGINTAIDFASINGLSDSDLEILSLSRDNLSTITAETPMDDVKAILDDIKTGISFRFNFVAHQQTILQLYQGITQNIEVVLEEMVE